jgi:hypothetical protein
MEKEIKKVLKSWESSLERFGKLDAWSFSKSLSTLGGYLRSDEGNSSVRSLIRQIRDRAICPSFNAELLLSLIRKVLMVDEPENDLQVYLMNANGEYIIQKNGQFARFRNETNRIFEEKLRFKSGMYLRNFDVETESPRDSKKVRRIVEKRMCQAYHRAHRRSHTEEFSNRDRYWKQRATAFQLYNIGQVENVTNVSRGLSTHWKVMFDPQTGQKVYKKKMAYSTEQEALEAVKKWKITHPFDLKEMHAYKCDYCDKWHIGHYDPVAYDAEKASINVAC